jgi:pimeloyl-ACP methyl ester carboxylesterase
MIEAVVQAGSFETAYRRAGRGGTVLVLLAGEDAKLGGWLFNPLAERFRTIAPDLPLALTTTPGVLTAWLPALIDGLGLDQPSVVASVAHAHDIQRLAADDPDRVGRLLLLRSDPDGQPAGRGTALMAGRDLAPRLVGVVGVPGADDPAGRSLALEAIVGFLAGPS